MKRFCVRAIALVFVFVMAFQLVSCSINQEAGENTCEAEAQSSVSGPKISISTLEPSGSQGYTTKNESYQLDIDQAVAVHTPVDYEELYVMSEHIDILQDINAFELSEISILYIEPYLVQEFLLSDSSMEMFFGFSVEDLQSKFGDVALTFADNGSVEKGVTIVPVEESSSANPYDYKSFFSKLAVGCGIIVIGATLSVATGGTFTCAMVAISKAALSGAVIAGAVTSTYYTAKGVSQGKSITKAFENSCSTALNAFGDAYVIGAILGSAYAISHPVCFVSGTLVNTPEGHKAIENISKGDMVYSHNITKNQTTVETVTDIFVSETTELVHITIANETISCSPTHPFWIMGKGWVEAQALTTQDKVYLLNGDTQEISSLRKEVLQDPVPVYNFEVGAEGYHTYFVGENQVLVHNRCNINSKYAGKTKYFEEGTELAAKYPDGVAFSTDGYACFDPYAKVKITFNQGVLNGNHSYDFKVANDYIKAITYKAPPNYTWHHVQDGRTLLLVPSDLHSAVRHTGGASILRGGN
ncbi:MAG: HNH endonuclease [Clostridia bacterium]|nr:HNH endonuclease [Clostridia bacterium]